MHKFSASKNEYRIISNLLTLGVKTGLFGLAMFFLILVPTFSDNNAVALCVPVCNPGSCIDTCGGFTCTGNPCSDGNACTNPDSCNGAGVCVGGAPTVCNPDSCAGLVRSFNGICNPGTGLCGYSAQNCNDGNSCTTDSCAPASCTNAWVAPTCNSLTLTPTEIIRFGNITFTASTNCATVASIDNGVGAIPPNGNKTISYNPPAGVFTTTYWMSLIGPGGNAPNACSATEDLLPRCMITADKTEMAPGNELTLTYSTWDADPLSANTITVPPPTFSPFPAVAAIVAGPTDLYNDNAYPTTYTLTVTAVNAKTNTCSVTVNPLTYCNLISPTTSITPVVAGTPVNISWTSSGATDATLTPPGAVVAVNGSRNVFPTVTTTYKLDVTGTGTGFCTATVDVIPLVIPICSLETSLTTMNVGQGTKLKWATTNAVSANIDHDVGNVMPVGVGETFYFPTAPGSYPMIMTVTSSSGNIATCSTANITVNAAAAVPVYADKGKYKEFDKSVGIVLNDVARTLLSFMGGLALLVFIVSGIYFMMSRGNPEIYGKAKRMLLYSIFGLFIIMISYALLVVIEGLAS